MRYLILSDIHANATALEAALGAAKDRWDKVLCLGDVVGYGPDPNEVIDRVRELGAKTIRGNHDKAGSGIANADDFNPVARNVALWTRNQLRPENRVWLEELPTGPATVDGFSLVHGAHRDEDEYVFAPAQALDGLLDAPSPITFFGHTHLQGGFTLRDNKVGVLHFKPADGAPVSRLTIEPGTTYLLNPGSVGQPRDGDPRAAFAISDIPNNTVDFWRVPYDIEAVQKRIAGAADKQPIVRALNQQEAMEPGETPYREERRRLPMAFLAGAVIVILIFGAFLLLTQVMRSHDSPAVVKFPFGPAEQAYVPHIQFLDIQLAHATNFLNQDFTYVAGTVFNDGPHRVRGLEVTVEFHDPFQQVILRDSNQLIGSQDASLGAGQRRDFQVQMEHLPAQWDKQYPSIRVTGLALE